MSLKNIPPRDWLNIKTYWKSASLNKGAVLTRCNSNKDHKMDYISLYYIEKIDWSIQWIFLGSMHPTDYRWWSVYLQIYRHLFWSQFISSFFQVSQQCFVSILSFFLALKHCSNGGIRQDAYARALRVREAENVKNCFIFRSAELLKRQSLDAAETFEILVIYPTLITVDKVSFFNLKHTYMQTQ